VTTLLSLSLCAHGWPDARISLYVDLIILAALLLGPAVTPLAANLGARIK
jgi:hypothetical protein